MVDSTGRRIDLALFLPSLRGGGAERVLLDLGTAFAERGLQVDLVAASLEGPMVAQVPSPIRAIDLRAGSVLRSLPALTSYLKEERPRVLLSALDHANLVAITARRLARAGVRVVVSVHGVPSEMSRVTPGVRAFLIPYMLRYFYPGAAAVVAVSRGVANDLVRSSRVAASKIHVIHNPVRTESICSPGDTDPPHPWLAAGQPPLVISAGRLAPEKDYGTLLEAFEILLRSIPARLVILGEGNEREHLEGQVEQLRLSDVVELPGFVTSPAPFLQRARLFVSSSRTEAFGNALVEAMACGTPVVSTDCHGPAEILDGGRYGPLVPTGEPGALAEAMLHVLRSPPDPESLRARAVTFSVAAAVEAYQRVLFPDSTTDN